jgi:hypothetical protein
MLAVYAVGEAIGARTLRAVLAAPYHDWLKSWHAFDLGAVAPAFVWCAPVAVPTGPYIASLAWQRHIYRLETGLAGRNATAPVVFDERQWRRQARAALGRCAAPGAVPLTDARGRIVIGATIRAIGHRWSPVLALPYQVMGRHQVIIGSSGCGKTNLMIRTWAAWYTAALRPIGSDAALRNTEDHPPKKGGTRAEKANATAIHCNGR